MLFRKRIRSQMYYGVTILFVIVLVLSISALQGGFKFRKLTKSIRERSRELPLTAKLSHQVSDLRVAFSQIDQPCDFSSHLDESVMGPLYWADQFGMRLGYVSSALEDYAYQLENNRPSDPRIGDISLELQSVAGLRKSLQELYQKTQRATWVNDRGVYEDVGIDLNKIQHDVSKLPEYLKQRMDSFAELARTEYHAWISLSVLMMLGAVVLLFFLMRRFHMRIFQPLDTLVNGSRRVSWSSVQKCCWGTTRRTSAWKSPTNNWTRSAARSWVKRWAARDATITSSTRCRRRTTTPWRVS